MMEQELIELLLASKKALQTGQSICAQANHWLQTSELHVETISKVYPKLVFADNHILVQLSVLDKIKDYVVSHIDHCKTRINDRESHLQALTMELTSIFNLLKQCNIDPDILRVNQERAKDQQQYSCLFDYISDQEIIELQQQADDEIGDMETANNVLQNQVKWLSGFIADITKTRTKSLVIPLDEATAAYSSQKIQIQEEEISNMADILTSLTNHYDQLGEATRMYQSDPEKRSALDITVLQEDHEHIPTILEELKHSLDIVESISQEIQTRMNVYLQVKADLLKISYQLDTFSTPGGQADSMLEKLADTEMEIKERELNLDEFFKQLSALAEWYQCYASSYNYLLLEIERRKKAEERQEAQRKELMKAFEDAYHDELQERRSWSAQHGQYLPEVLCPFINDPPSILIIQRNDSNTHRLPDLLPENVQKALSEIHHAH